jgi:nucleolar GTP-binding protein
MDEDGLSPEQRQLLGKIRARKIVVLARHRRQKSAANNQALLPRRADAQRSINTTAMKVPGFALLSFSLASPGMRSAAVCRTTGMAGAGAPWME